MIGARFFPRWVIGLFALSLGLGISRQSPATSQELRSENDQTVRRSSGADFLFGSPKAAIGVRGGWNFAGTNSDIYEFVTEQLTIDKGDFSAPAIAVDFSYRLGDRLALVTGFEYSGTDIQSEFRDWVDQDDQPILQTTRLRTVPLTGSLKYFLVPQGREISRYAWVPSSFVPYVGGGGGLIWYQFQQAGDFVDFEDLSIFPDTFESKGWSYTFHLFGGMNFKISRRLFMTFELRYAWADSNLREDFVGFDPIDLSGLTTTAGIEILF